MTSKVVRLYTPPQATLTDPHAQIKWMFFQLEAESEEPRAAGVRYARNKYLEFIDKTKANYKELISNPRFYLERYWEADALIRFNTWLNAQKLASKSRYGIYKTVRQVMDMAYALRVIDAVVYHAPMFKGTSETKERSAYSDVEQQVINASVAKWMGLAVNILRGYEPTGLGVPYRKKEMVSSLSLDGQASSLTEVAKTFNIQPGTISRRVRQGWTPRQALGLAPRIRGKVLDWKIKGIEYQSMSEVAKEFGVATNTIYYRISKGWTPEQILGLEPSPVRGHEKNTGRPIPTTVREMGFQSLRAASRHFGVSYSALQSRLSCGWTTEEALGLTPRPSPSTTLTVEGVEYRSMTAAAKAYGLDHGVVSLRLRLGHTPEQAVGVVPTHVSRSDDRALLWVFENDYGCDPVAMLNDFHGRKRSAVCTEERLRKLFSRWGVWPNVDDRLVMPLVVEFGMLTGLNVEALKLLEVDSLQMQHPLTGRPAITYRKPRSASPTRSEDKELHIPLLEVEELYLDGPVAEKVHRLFILIVAITARIRKDASPEISRLLFIFEDVERSRKMKRTIIVSLDPKGKANTWYGRFSREESLYDTFGPKFSFNISRCRPTLVTNMVLAGAPMFQVQAVLGHGTIGTTASYLDAHALRPVFNKTVSEALKRISARSVNARKVISIRVVSAEEASTGANTNFHETLSGCGCTNPYSPSENVRLVTKYKKGSVCKFWNMCLLCDSAIVTESSLPKLIVYRSRVAAALAENSNSISVRRKLLQAVIELIDGMLKPNVIFPEVEIEKARCLAASMDDLLVDQLIYQGL